MLTLEQLENKIDTLAQLIGADKNLLPTFGHSEQTGRPHIEITGNEYHFVICERGEEYKRNKTKDLSELLFQVFDSVTFEMACSLELNNRKQNEDFRIQLFEIQEKLIFKIDKSYSDRLHIKHVRLLR
jgi:hypothetical protein